MPANAGLAVIANTARARTYLVRLAIDQMLEVDVTMCAPIQRRELLGRGECDEVSACACGHALHRSARRVGQVVDVAGVVVAVPEARAGAFRDREDDDAAVR